MRIQVLCWHLKYISAFHYTDLQNADVLQEENLHALQWRTMQSRCWAEHKEYEAVISEALAAGIFHTHFGVNISPLYNNQFIPPVWLLYSFFSCNKHKVDNCSSVPFKPYSPAYCCIFQGEYLHSLHSVNFLCVHAECTLVKAFQSESHSVCGYHLNTMKVEPINMHI